MLHAPDFSKSFILQTDTSDKGYGVVLTQKDDNGKEHPILFLSKKLTATERKYSTTEKECAAILYAIKKLKGYIDGRQRGLIGRTVRVPSQRQSAFTSRQEAKILCAPSASIWKFRK
ncbi:retrovirus-related Pol polyprotein from transposon 17.6 [Trichonephila clavipes]|nr:retrovirus-related Pol polyprotein from transposon 17.6 [Trichonephila clavipes]